MQRTLGFQPRLQVSLTSQTPPPPNPLVKDHARTDHKSPKVLCMPTGDLSHECQLDQYTSLYPSPQRAMSSSVPDQGRAAGFHQTSLPFCAPLSEFHCYSNETISSPRMHASNGTTLERLLLDG